MTKDQMLTLIAALSSKRQLEFPVSAWVVGFICGKVYGTKRRDVNEYRKTLRHRILTKYSSAYRNILEFIKTVGIRNVDIKPIIEESSLKTKLQVSIAENREPDWSIIIRRVHEE